MGVCNDCLVYVFVMTIMIMFEAWVCVDSMCGFFLGSCPWVEAGGAQGGVDYVGHSPLHLSFCMVPQTPPHPSVSQRPGWSRGEAELSSLWSSNVINRYLPLPAHKHTHPDK